ncbi:MAG TPA: DNA repair protein RecO [Gemmatimonadaceae bacterium]|jgi:DNA repair protein RecO (recombination protein O)|nr:DNA repair protein RecO [Gemmatimonadaceae bacterium]
MSLLVTDAIVLHAFDYLESSRIIRLLTREAGVQSVLARGARKSRGRYGSALDLFAEGTAQIYIKPNRELHNLSSFELSRARSELAFDIGRFTAAAAITELALRFGGEEANPLLYETVADSLDLLTQSSPGKTVEDGLAGCWRIISVLGFTPELASCALCHTPLRDSDDATFSHAAGGIVCPSCSRLAPIGRRIPATARRAIRGWLEAEVTVETLRVDAAANEIGENEGRSHQRLLREFIGAHVGDDRPLRAFAVWEHERWSAA